MKVKPTLINCIALLLSILLPLAVLAAVEAPLPLTQCLATGCIDWSAGVVHASGTGLPTFSEDRQKADRPSTGLKIAREIARQKLLATVAAIRIDSKSRISDRMADDDDFRKGLQALVRNAAVTQQEYLSDGTVKIELSMNLTGGFAQFVLPEEIRQVDTVTAVVGNASASAAAGSRNDEDQKDRYTGLIVDAIGIGARPALVPTIIDESGTAIYGPAFVSREFAVSRGMSGFATTQAAALMNKRVGEHPMVVRAIRTDDESGTILVIANADGARLRSSAQNLDFLKACRVCIVIDAPAGDSSGAAPDKTP